VGAGEPLQPMDYYEYLLLLLLLMMMMMMMMMIFQACCCTTITPAVSMLLSVQSFLSMSSSPCSSMSRGIVSLTHRHPLPPQSSSTDDNIMLIVYVGTQSVDDVS